MPKNACFDFCINILVYLLHQCIFMETEQDEIQTVSSNGKKVYKYPFKELSYILQFGGNIYNRLDHTAYNKAEAIAAVNNLKPASIKQILTACQLYNILELKHRVGYKLTPEFYKITQPSSDTEKQNTIIQCLQAPELYKELFGSYNGLKLPQKEFIVNRLVREYGFIKGVADTATDVFLSNLSEYKLVNAYGILTLKKATSVSEAKTDEPTETPSHDEHAHDSQPKNKEQQNGHRNGINMHDQLASYEFPLTGTKKAVLYYPKSDMVSEDFEIMLLALELLAKTKRLTLKLQVKEDEKATGSNTSGS